MQLDELKRAKNSAFNWSDEELLGDMEDMTDIVYKDKYTRRKSKANTAYSQIKQSVKRGYTQAKETLSGSGASGTAKNNSSTTNAIQK